MSPDGIRDIFLPFGPVTVRRMFGGAGVFADGVMFALEADGILYLKVDAVTREDFAAEHCLPFTYATRDGEKRIDSYWSFPERLYDEPKVLADWAQRAHAVALRAARPRAVRGGPPNRRRRVR